MRPRLATALKARLAADHPEVADVVRAARAAGMTVALNTNGFLLTREIIGALGDAASTPCR
jgi:pyruvate-formate lyase-activating enzyme